MTDWTDRTDPEVIRALTAKCGMGGCAAKPGLDCVSTIPNQPLPRIVHHYRLDKLLTAHDAA